MSSNTFSRRDVLGGLAGTLALTSGCLASAQSPAGTASDWTQRGYDPGQTFYKFAGRPPVDDATVAWTATTGSRFEIGRSDYDLGTPLVVAGDTVYLPDGTRLDRTDGTVLGRTSCQINSLIGLARTESYGDGVVVSDGIADNQRALTGLRPALDSGVVRQCQDTVRWRAGAPADIDTYRIARIADGTVYTVTHFNTVVALDADDGRQTWTTPVDVSPWWLLVDGDALCIHDDGRSEGTLSVLDRHSGAHRSTVRIPPSAKLMAVRDGLAYFSVGDWNSGVLSVVDWNRDDTWTLDPTTAFEDTDDRFHVASLAVGPDTVFVSWESPDGIDSKILALDPRDGSVRWVQTLLDSWPLLSATDDVVYASLGRGRLLALDSETGQQRWSVQPDVLADDSSRSRLSTPVVADRRLLARTSETVVALEEP